MEKETTGHFLDCKKVSNRPLSMFLFTKDARALGQAEALSG